MKGERQYIIRLDRIRIKGVSKTVVFIDDTLFCTNRFIVILRNKCSGLGRDQLIDGLPDIRI